MASVPVRAYTVGMDILVQLRPFTLADLVAVASLFAAWAAIGWRIDHPDAARPSVSVLMAAYRRDWMKRFAERDNRIFDAQIMASLRQSTTFFASTCLIAIGGLLAMIGNTAALESVAQELTQDGAPTVVWQVKLLLVVVFLTLAFLKFVWANRVFGYCSVLMGAVPNDSADPETPVMAARAADLNIRAAANFNRGLRAMYFALAALAWALSPFALMTATVLTVWVLWSREFASGSRGALSGPTV